MKTKSKREYLGPLKAISRSQNNEIEWAILIRSSSPLVTQLAWPTTTPKTPSIKYLFRRASLEYSSFTNCVP